MIILVYKRMIIVTTVKRLGIIFFSFLIFSKTVTDGSLLRSAVNGLDNLTPYSFIVVHEVYEHCSITYNYDVLYCHVTMKCN